VTARVCHDHFEKVIIVEPEASLITAEAWKPEREPTKRTRARVMQYQSLQGVFAAYSIHSIDWKLTPHHRHFGVRFHGLGKTVSQSQGGMPES
jgi:hypothetical protein